MDVTLLREDGCQKVYKVTASWTDIATRFHEVTQAFSGQARMPGFRAGKAPEAMVRARFKKEIREEVLEHLLDDSAKKAIEQFGLDPVVPPYAGEIHLEEEQDFSGEITVEVPPVVPELTAEGLAVECPRIDVSEEDVAKTLEGIRQRAAILKPVEGEAQEGDYATVILRRKGQSKGLERFFAANAQSNHPVERALQGRKTGDEFTVHAEAEEDHHHDHDHDHDRDHEDGHGHDHSHEPPQLAPGEYEITVKDLVRREVPELGDDLAKEAGAKSLEDLTAGVRAELQARAESAMRGRQEDALLEALAAKYAIPVPSSIVDRQVRADLEEIAESLARQGMDVEKANLDWSKMAESMRPAASLKVVAYYLLGAAARQYGLEATAEDVDAYFAAQAQGTRHSQEQLKAAAQKEQRLDSIKALIAHRKAVGLLLSQASVRVVEVTAPTQEAP